MPQPASQDDPADVSSSRLASSSLTDLLDPIIRARSLVRRFAAGEVVVAEGDTGSSAFILVDGACDVSVHGEVLTHTRAGEIFGEIACFEERTRTATVRATVSSEALEIAAQDLHAELQRSPMLLEAVLQTMARRARDISRREAEARDEHRELRRVLESFHPSIEPFRDHPLLSVEVRWQPFSFASGDFYDVLTLSPNRFLFAVGDVMGHGARTAPAFGMIRSQLHECTRGAGEPHEWLAHLHQHMRRHGHPDMFVTLTLLVVDFERMTARFSVAGPPCPLLYRQGVCRALTPHIGWTLGYPFDGITFQTETIALASGDMCLLYTDGLSDATVGPVQDYERLGSEQLARMFEDICQERSTGVADALFARVDQYRSGWPFDDDATALVLRVR